MIADKAVDTQDEHMLFVPLFCHRIRPAVESHAGGQIEFRRQLPAAHVYATFRLAESQRHGPVSAGYRQWVC